MTRDTSILLLSATLVALSITTSSALQSPHQRAPRRNYGSPAVREGALARRRKGADDDIFSLEQEVLESTRAKLDMKRVQNAFLENDEYRYGSSNNSNGDYADEYGNNAYALQERGGAVESWKVALSAGVVSAVAANFLLFHSFILSSMVCVAVFLVANGDPLEEDSVAGALARVVGRFTLESVQVSQPKVRAIARAAVRGDEEVMALQRQVQELEYENAELFLWKQRRQAVDEALSEFNVDELKAKAREHHITIGGTKSQLLMRLVEAEIVRL